eukprot:1070347-Pyramimonas_sp.AAC.1
MWLPSSRQNWWPSWSCRSLRIYRWCRNGTSNSWWPTCLWNNWPSLSCRSAESNGLSTVVLAAWPIAGFKFVPPVARADVSAGVGIGVGAGDGAGAIASVRVVVGIGVGAGVGVGVDAG